MEFLLVIGGIWLVYWLFSRRGSASRAFPNGADPDNSILELSWLSCARAV